jgi:hypothetical protein
MKISGSEQKLITSNKYSLNRNCKYKTPQLNTARPNSNNNLEIKYTDRKLHQADSFIKTDTCSDGEEI